MKKKADPMIYCIKVTMDYCTFGRGKRTLVIIPGLSVQSVMPSARDIAEGYRLLTDDYRVYDLAPDYSQRMLNFLKSIR